MADSLGFELRQHIQTLEQIYTIDASDLHIRFTTPKGERYYVVARNIQTDKVADFRLHLCKFAHQFGITIDSTTATSVGH